MNTWMSLLTLPVQTRPDWTVQRQNGQGLKNRGAPGRILAALADRQWRTADDLAAVCGQERKQVCSNLKRMRDRGDVVSRPSQLRNPMRPHGHLHILEWSLP